MGRCHKSPQGLILSVKTDQGHQQNLLLDHFWVFDQVKMIYLHGEMLQLQYPGFSTWSWGLGYRGYLG